jgi:Ca2+-transporting ATPase
VTYDAVRNTGRAVAFSLLALSPLAHAANCRSATASIFTLTPGVSRPLVLAVALSTLIHLVVFIPALRPVFRTFAMGAGQWILLLVLSASIIPAMELWKVLLRRRIVAPASRRPTA